MSLRNRSRARNIDLRTSLADRRELLCLSKSKRSLVKATKHMLITISQKPSASWKKLSVLSRGRAWHGQSWLNATRMEGTGRKPYSCGLWRPI